MAEELDREYNIEDALMLQTAHVFHDNFVIDKVDFETLFLDMADPFAADFMTAIDTAENAVPGWQVEAEIATVTANLNDAMRAGQKALQVLFVYVERTWESDYVLKEYGKAQYKLDRSKQSKLPNLMLQAHTKATETANAAALAAKGYTGAMATDLETKAQAIEDLNNEQELLLNARTQKTAIRVGKYNAVWNYMKKINQASKVVFSDDPAKIEMYLLYPTSSQSLPKPQGLNATLDGVDPTTANITWDPVPGADTYKVYFSEVAPGQPSGTYGELTEVNGVNFVQLPVIAAKRNYWKIKAYGGGMVSAYSNEVWLEG